MNSKSVACVTVMLASFPIAYIIPFPIASVTLLSIICAVFIGKLKLWRVALVFIPMYFLIMNNVFFSLPDLIVTTASSIGLPPLFWLLPLAYFFVSCELTIFGLVHLLLAKLLLKKTGVTKRLGDLHA